MGSIPFKSRIPVPAWLLAAFFALVSVISSLAGHEASVGMKLAQALQ